MHERHSEETNADVVTIPGAGDEIVRIRLVDAPAGTKVQLDNGRVVVATGAVIQGARFVRPVLAGAGDVDARSGHVELRLGSMEILHGDQLVTVA